MNRRSLAVAVLLIWIGAQSMPEATRLAFYPPEALFTDRPCVFPAFSSWMLLDHTLNQAETTNTAHCFDTGSFFTFYADERFSFAGLAREMFQFRASPEDEWRFWARALVTDLRLSLSVNISPFVASAGYRHDCKHDIEKKQREVIHDSAFLQARFPLTRITALVPTLNMHIGMLLEGETNLKTIFQEGPEESDRARFTAEGEFIPCATGDGLFSTFVNGRVSLINRAQVLRVSVASNWNVDALMRTGVELHTGMGGVRLSYSLERITDDWTNLNPTPQTISSISLHLLYNSDPR